MAVLDPDPARAARAVSDWAVTAGFDDPEAAAALARMSDVVSFEIERPAPEALLAAARHVPVRPSPEVLRIVQDRARRKAWLAAHGFPLGAWLPAADADPAAETARQLAVPVRLKAAPGGYDGRGQARAATGRAPAPPSAPRVPRG